MKKSSLVLLIAITAGTWFALQRYDVRGLENLQLVRRSRSSSDEKDVPPPPEGKETIRIASFNLGAFDLEKSRQAATMDILARVIREFDVIAIQGLRSTRPEVLRMLMDGINQGEIGYSMVVGPEVDPTSQAETFAYLYNQATIQTDRSAAYVVEDPDGLLKRPPLVGWFRVRGPPENHAFTFTLVNVHAEPSRRSGKPAPLDPIYQSVFYQVRDDGRGEDDLIMLGVFNADDQHLGKLREIPGLLAAISATPTDTRRKNQYDNLVFQLPAIGEYTGRSGVFDFLREYNLTLDEALQVSDHLPVWAEFSAREGSEIPAMAGRRGITRRP